MSSGDNEVNNIWRHLFVNGAEVAADADTAAFLVRMVKSMVVQERMKVVLLKKTDALVSSFLLRRPHFPIPLAEVAVENYFHGRR